MLPDEVDTQDPAAEVTCLNSLARLLIILVGGCFSF